MTTLRAEGQRALLVVDVQVGVVHDAWEAPRVVGNVARAVARARAADLPVIWVQHHSEELVRDSAAWQWVPELRPADGEALVHKRFNSAFEDTALEDELASRQVSHIVLAGAMTNWCIRATAHGALERGYDLTLLSDAHTTESMVLGDGTRIDAAGIVQELNAAMAWMRYVGARNAATTVDEFDFGAHKP